MKYILVLFIALLPITATAQSNEPVEITAQKHLEWDRTANTFTAQGAVKATQGDMSIETETLRATYNEGGNGKGIDIRELSANDNVTITSAQNKLYGDRATYDVKKSYAKMTGGNLRMIAPDQTITATDRFEYWTNEGSVQAIGNVVITRPKPNGGGTDTLKANQVTVTLKTNAQGKRTVDRIETKGNVIITTPLETVTGNYGIYRATTNTAELTGGVTIKRGPNTLTGQRATVNLTTNISKIFGGTSTTTPNGRVRGVFYPGSQ